MKRYKPRQCERCGIVFVPRSNRTLFCDPCQPIAASERGTRWRAEHPGYYKQWCAANRDKRRRYDKQRHIKHYEQETQYRAEHRDEHREYNKQWNAEHPEYYKQWIAGHPDKTQEYSKRYYLRHPEIYRIQNHTRRARIKGNGGTYTLKELNELFEQQEGFCYYCGELLYASFDRDVHIEHKVPVSRGGLNDISNIVLSCSKCNWEKGTKTHDEYISINKTLNSQE